MSHQAAPAYGGAEADLDAYAAQAAHQLGEAVALLRGYLVVLEQRGERDPELGEALRGLSAGARGAPRLLRRPPAPGPARPPLPGRGAGAPGGGPPAPPTPPGGR